MATHDPEASASPGPVVSRTRTMRKPRGRLYVFAALLLPVALTVLAVNRTAPAVESTLASEAGAALTQGKIKGVELDLDGRVVTAKVPTGVDADAVETVLDTVTGISDVEIVSVYASKKEAQVCASLQERIDRATKNQRIPFEGTSTRLTPVGERMVKDVGKLLKICKAARVTVGGHTDDSTFNGATVSLKRARVMINRLKSQGIALDRMTPRGYGDQFPVDDGETAAGRAANQRGSIDVEAQ